LAEEVEDISDEDPVFVQTSFNSPAKLTTQAGSMGMKSSTGFQPHMVPQYGQSEAMRMAGPQLTQEDNDMLLCMQGMAATPYQPGLQPMASLAMNPWILEPFPRAAHTSLMMRNLPNCYTRAMLLDLLKAEGFAGSFDFIYLPIDFRRGLGLGYAFINFVSTSVADSFMQRFSGFTQWHTPSDKVCEVTCSDTLHGTEALIEHYRNSPVMHESVPDEHKPMLFDGLERKAFPPPTKRLRAPRLWHYRRKHE